MKTAEELMRITKSKIPDLVLDIMDGVEEHIIKRIEEEANKGSTYYTINLKKSINFIKEELLKECMNLAKIFEDSGYLVSIDDDGNGYYIDFMISLSWNGELYIPRGYISKLNHLYETNINNEIKDCSTCKNNIEYPPPHTCDVCTSLDQEEEYEMWEVK